MLDALLYVSYSTLYIPDDEAVVQAIVRQSRQRNASLCLTGALLFTHQRFAQYIEGSEVAIAELMSSIRRDPRHRDIQIISTGRSRQRIFSGWDMAYAGPSEPIAARVDALLGVEPQQAGGPLAGNLIELMSALARTSAPDLAA
jgi:hypothetical protein